MNQSSHLPGTRHPIGPVGLRRDAGKIAGALPPLLAEALLLASAVSLGEHGRRRAGPGESFWQFRQAQHGDPRSQIDWRRSGRSDAQFIREMEWENAQTVSIWVDDALSMDYRSEGQPHSKHDRSSLLALALSVLLADAHERISLMGTGAAPARTGRAQLNRMAVELGSGPRDDRPEYGQPPMERLSTGGRAVFFSDFLGDPDNMLPVFSHVADRGVRGCFVQVLDETEEMFPFDGRMIFESIGGATEFEAQRAGALREKYQAKLKERRARLDELARSLGWQCLHHRTSQSPRSALLWLYMAIGTRAP